MKKAAEAPMPTMVDNGREFEGGGRGGEVTCGDFVFMASHRSFRIYSK
jgi:hypothetical protein